MNQEESFKEWLPNNGVHGKGVGSYRSYVSCVEKNLGNIDQLLKKDIEDVVDLITAKKFPQRAPSTLLKYRSAVRKYNDFLKAD